jgi:tetrahydromethanopterin S-methyltransferase subunit G
MDQDLKDMLQSIIVSQEMFQNQVIARFDKVDAGFDKVDARLDKVDARLDKVDARLDKVDARLDKVDTRLDKVEGEISIIRTQLDRIEYEGNSDVLGVLEVMNAKLELTATKDDIDYLAMKLGQHDLEIDRLKRVK